MAPRERLTYDDFGRATRELAQEICDSGFAPDIVLSIARGGFFLGAGLGYALGVKNAFVMSVEFYTGINERLEMPVVLYEKPETVIRPDYSWKKTDKWIDFPWSCDGPVTKNGGLAH